MVRVRDCSYIVLPLDGDKRQFLMSQHCSKDFYLEK